MRASTRLSALCLAALLSGAAPAFAEPALADLVVNGEPRGTVSFELGPDNAILLAPATVHAVLDGVAKPSIVDDLVAGTRLVTKADLAARGIAASFDSARLVLSVDLDPLAMPTRPVNVLGSGKPGPAAGGAPGSPNAPVSLSAGLGLELSPSYASGPAGLSFEGRLELSPALRVFGLVAEADASVDAGAAGLSWNLPTARLVLDVPSAGARLQGGIVGTGPVAFQSGRELYGLAFAKDPALPGNNRPLGSLPDGIALRRPAYVSVVVNGAVIRKTRLGPGTYGLEDLPLTSGLNDLTVVIEEEGQAPRTMHLGIPFDGSLLGPGRTDWSLSLGVSRADPAEPFASGHVAAGLGPRLQAGLDAQAGYGSFLGGGGLLAALPVGSLGLDGAVSAGYAGAAAGVAPAWAGRAYWRFSMPSLPLVPRLGASASYRSRGFLLPASSPLAAPSLELSGQIGQSLPGIRGSLNLFGNASLSDNALESWSATLGFALSFGRGMSLSVAGGEDWSRAQGPGPRIAIGFTAVPKAMGAVSYTQSLSPGSDGEDLSVGLDPAGKARIGLSSRGGPEGNGSRAVDLSGSTRFPGFALSGRAGATLDTASSSFGLSGSLRASTTLLLAGGILAATGAQGQAWAVMVPKSELSGQKVEMRPLRGSPVSSDGQSPAVAGGLTPYEPWAAGIELPESPPDARPDPSTILLAPAYRSVSVIRVGTLPSYNARGRLVDRDGKPVAFMPGDLVDDAGHVLPLSGTFTDEGGVFECFGLSRGLHTILWADGSVLSFRIGEPGSGSTLDLGARTAGPAPEGWTK